MREPDNARVEGVIFATRQERTRCLRLLSAAGAATGPSRTRNYVVAVDVAPAGSMVELM